MTDNECDGKEYPGFMPEGTDGNGFDDDCDGLIDEGCFCKGWFSTKDCYAIPSSQTKAPEFEVQGWCTMHAKGKTMCIKHNATSEAPYLAWGADCMGASVPPSTDQCVLGDLNCDGVPLNAPGGCLCSQQ